MPTVKLLVDMNLSPSWIERLARHGFEAVRSSTIGRYRPDPDQPKQHIVPGQIRHVRRRERDAVATGTVVLDGKTLVDGSTTHASIGRSTTTSSRRLRAISFVGRFDGQVGAAW